VAAATGKPGRKSTKQMLEQPVEQASTSYSTQLPPELASRTSELAELLDDPQNPPDSLLADDTTGAPRYWALPCLPGWPLSLAALHLGWPASKMCVADAQQSGLGRASCQLGTSLDPVPPPALRLPCLCLPLFAPPPQGLVRLSGLFHAGRTVTSLAQSRPCWPARRAVMARRRLAPASCAAAPF
jgi:hypothetical protein